MNEVQVGFLEYITKYIEIDKLPKKIDEIHKILKYNNNFKKIIEQSNTIEINAVILVKNQVDLIKSAIDSALKISNTVTVIDTGSTDGTWELLQSINQDNVILYQREWVENYSYMRNLANDLVQDGWVFIIDSDEKLSVVPNLRYLKIFLSFLEFVFPDNDFSISFKQTAPTMKAVSWPQRLYRKSETMEFFGYVHEELRSNKLIDIRTQFVVYNQGTSKEEQIRFDKAIRYNQLLLKNIDLEPNNLKWFSLLSIEEGFENKDWYISRLKFFVEKVLYSNSTKEDIFEVKLVMTYIVAALIFPTDIENGKKVIDSAKLKYPNMEIFYYYDYLYKIDSWKNSALTEISNLKKDLEIIKSYTQTKDWNYFNKINYLPDIMVKLLIKAEEYQLAYELFQSLEHDDSIDKTILSAENNFLREILIN